MTNFTEEELNILYYYVNKARMDAQVFARRNGLIGSPNVRELDELEAKLQVIRFEKRNVPNQALN